MVLRLLSHSDDIIFLKAIKENIACHACFITELADHDSFFIYRKASDVGLASLLLSIDQYSESEEEKVLWTNKLWEVCGEVVTEKNASIDECYHRVSMLPGATIKKKQVQQ